MFAPPRAGLFLGEVEFETDEEMRAFAPPAWAIAEVTRDVRFAGGCLVTTTETELLSLFAVR